MGAGCYHIEQKPKSKDIVKAHSKVYAAVTPEEVFQASEQIFNLADEGDLDMVQDTRRLKVSRAVSDRQMPPNREVWEIQAIPVNGSTQVIVSVALKGRRSRKVYPRNPDVYHLFYSRLEYLLGKSKTWVTCEDYEAQAHHKPYWDEDGFLCLNADDVRPFPPNGRGEGI